MASFANSQSFRYRVTAFSSLGKQRKSLFHPSAQRIQWRAGRHSSICRNLVESTVSIIDSGDIAKNNGEPQMINGDSDGENKSTVSITVVGASGDLAIKKIFPALFNLFYEHCLPQNFSILGYSMNDMTDAEFKQKVSKTLTCFRENCEKIEEFLNSCFYHSGKYDSQEDFAELDKVLKKHEAGRMSNRVFYFSIPPDYLVDAVKNATSYASSSNGWTRAVFESETSISVTRCLKDYLKEEQIFRMNQFITKKLVHTFWYHRRSTLLSRHWSSQHIRSVQIIFSEDFGTEGQGGGGHFDEYGVVQGLMQSLELLAFMAMETPANSEDPENIRNEKVKLLSSIRAIRVRNIVFGQYAGYTDEETVPKNSPTPTFAAIALFIDNPRWYDVPILIKGGRGVETKTTEIRVKFKHCMGIIEGFDELVFVCQPDHEAIYLKLTTKNDLGITRHKQDLEILDSGSYPKGVPKAYECLLLDAIRGDKWQCMYFTRSDELEAARAVLNPVFEKIKEDKKAPESYAYGGQGPLAANDLAGKYRVKWGEE